MLAVYHTVVMWPQEKDVEINTKYSALSKLHLIIENTVLLKEMTDVIDMTPYRKL